MTVELGGGGGQGEGEETGGQETRPDPGHADTLTPEHIESDIKTVTS